MNFLQSLNYLNSFANLERLTQGSPLQKRFLNLDRMRLLLEWAGHPEKAFFPVVIAGTKGKGSTGFFLESILSEAGIPCGFYSSPHLETPRERIRLQGRLISERCWAAGLSEIKRMLFKKRLAQAAEPFTYFEIMTLLAMLAFKAAKVRVGIFEVGLGGRLDAVNVLKAPLAVLTPIDMDHEDFLGNTLAKIAVEKAGIIHAGAEVVTAPQKFSALKVVRARVRQCHAVLHQVKGELGLQAGLFGAHQSLNAAVAQKTAVVLQARFGFVIPAAAVKRGLAKSHWPGRFEVMQGNPGIILDGAHNPVSVRALVAALKAARLKGPRVLVFGVTKDKNFKEMLRVLAGYFNEIIVTPLSDNPRGREIASMLPEAARCFKAVYPVASPEEALALACRKLAWGGWLAATGSFFLIGRLRPLVKKLP